MNLTGPGLAFPAKAQTSGTNVGVPSGFVNELLVSELLPRFSSLTKSGRVFSALATVTAPVIYSTAAGTGGPLIWNRPSSGVDVHVLAVTFGGFTTATSVAGSIGFTGAGGQSIAPTSTTAIDATGNMLVGGPASAVNVYRIGTPANPGTQFVPIIASGTGAITVLETSIGLIDVGGSFVIPPGTWGALAASATLTAGVVGLGLIWAELPA